MKLPHSFYNWLSIVGFIIAVNSLILILFLLIFTMISPAQNNYLGVYIYVVLPFFLVLGFILVPLGMFFRARKKRKMKEEKDRLPLIDLNLKEHRILLVKIMVITFIFLISSALGTYNAYRYINSVELCGELCHKEMEPEYITYLNSSHAKVPCVNCHEGSGVNWYFRSKWSFLQQVYAKLVNKYPRPIPTPLKVLRPERAICESCHWPQKFYTRKSLNIVTYLADSANTEWNISLLLKVGPKNSAHGLKEGIHWHTNPDFRIEYYTKPGNREAIPLVKSTNIKTGEVKVFVDQENKPDKQVLERMELRTMDCMDCHNRPSHLFQSAPVYIDNALVSGLLPKDLPFLKKIAMEVLKSSYSNKDVALIDIHDRIIGFYKEKQPVIWNTQKQKITNAVKVIQESYSKNAFPYMKVDAGSYPNHIGHLESDGCFRCHSGRHKTTDGKTISRDCNLCHTITEQGPANHLTFTSQNDTLEFIHPRELKPEGKKQFCSTCHRNLYD